MLNDIIKNLRLISHINIITFQYIYLNNNVLYFIYGYIDIFLAKIQITPYGKFMSFQIVIICKDV